jgi:hypothetical protein
MEGWIDGEFKASRNLVRNGHGRCMKGDQTCKENGGERMKNMRQMNNRRK